MKSKYTMSRPIKVLGGFVSEADKKMFRRMMKDAAEINGDNKSRRKTIIELAKDDVSANSATSVV